MKCLLPVPDGPHTTSTSARSIHSRVRSAFWVADGIAEGSDSQALDEVRRAYWNELRASGDKQAAKRFKDSRWSLLKKPEKLTDPQAATLARIRAAGGEVGRAYEHEEAVRGIFQPSLAVDDVEILIDRLLSCLSRSPAQTVHPPRQNDPPSPRRDPRRDPPRHQPRPHRSAQQQAAGT